mmetsp:Transcript_58421/g.92519  ORF Transcript_58421/g.92519 Transcript_58421/m.92519 type:complete len:234 (+) Transcript_58421:72-773(+)
MVRLYRWPVALGFLVVSGSSESCEDEQCMSLMQMKLETHHHLDGQAKSAAQGVCLQSMTWETYRKPIREVVRSEHPGYDGWCTYGLMGHIFSSCAVARKLQSLEGLESSQPMEDSYCSVNGWYDLPVDQAASNYSFVEVASRKYCDALQGQVLAAAENVSFADVAKMSAEHDSLDSPESKELPLAQGQKLSLQLLGAVKCFLSGHGRSATICDIARCAKRKAASDPVVTAPIR